MQEHSLFSIYSPAFIFCRLFADGHSDWCEVIAHCRFALHACSATQSCPTLWDPMDCSCQAPLTMEFSRQEYWSELPFPTPRDLPDPVIKPTSPASPALSGGLFTTVAPGKLMALICISVKQLLKPENLENLAVARDRKKSVFILIPKKVNVKKMLKLPHSCTHLHMLAK